MSNETDWFFDSSEFDPSSNLKRVQQTSRNVTQTSQPRSLAMHAKKPIINTDTPSDDCHDIVTEIETNLGCSFSNNDKETEKSSKTTIDSLKKSNTELTAETLKVFSSINIETLDFNSRFDLLFNDMSMLKATAVQGLLGNTNFRFLAWMIFLECIPMDRNKWIASIDQNRSEYEKIKETFSCDPRKEGSDLDHPLSQDETSVWNKYFNQNSIKSVIIQDVNRIQQHSEYFTHDSTKDSIVDLLFIYVQSANLEYKQGMHEILTCIIYVLHEEYKNLSKLEHTNEFIQVIADLKFLHHDAYIIFKALMSRINNWFETKSNNKLNGCSMLDSITEKRRNSLTCITPKLFNENEEFYESYIINKINFITNSVLQNNEIEVYNHLGSIGVSLHPFGIRWLRLLFLRELEFPSSLILWDAMFATDNVNLDLVDYLFVALLVCLRDEILKMDNSSCMKLLMQPHFYLDPLDVLKTALYLQNPAIYKRPNSMEHSYEFITPSVGPSGKSVYRSRSNQILNASPLAMQPMNTNEVKVHSNSSDRNNNKHLVHGSPSKVSSKTKRNLHGSVSEFDLARLVKKLDYDYINVTRLRRPGAEWGLEMKMRAVEHMCHNTDLVTHAYISKIQELQLENDKLKKELQHKESLCLMASTKVKSNADYLAREINKTDDLVILAIDGLHQISKQLSQNFEFSNQTSLLE